MPESRNCQVKHIEECADGIFSITVEAGDVAENACPGQFVHVSCGAERLLRRPISVCSVKGTELRMVFEVVGKGTKWLSQLNKGSELSILGPLGNGFSLKGEKIIVVGGGIGVPPVLYAAQVHGNADAVLGFRSADKIILAGEFERKCRDVYITTDDGSYGEKGFVSLPLQRLLEEETYDGVLACGPKAMLRSVAMVCMQHNVNCQVSMEERMGCGVGACLVCACRTKSGGGEHIKRVCRDGPVFDAREVVW